MTNIFDAEFIKAHPTALQTVNGHPESAWLNVPVEVIISDPSNNGVKESFIIRSLNTFCEKVEAEADTWITGSKRDYCKWALESFTKELQFDDRPIYSFAIDAGGQQGIVEYLVLKAE